MSLLTQGTVYLVVTKCLDNLRNVKQNGILERVENMTLQARTQKKCLNCGTLYEQTPNMVIPWAFQSMSSNLICTVSV